MYDNQNFRQESDPLGTLNIPHNILWGIHTGRALENFVDSSLPRYFFFYKAFSQVKLAAAQTNLELNYLEPSVGKALISALEEMIEGKWIEHYVVDPMQGGAGTSTNMNINEIAANRATQIMGGKLGEYLVNPLEHVNLHQSTNDTYPTSVKIAVYYFLQELESKTNQLLESLQEKEQQWAHIIKLGRTELMPAVPTTLGKSFSAYADLIARDRWRIFKSMERIRQTNLGGTAIGLGTAAPKDYIFKVSEKIKGITNLPLARSENLIDATQNTDQVAEVFAMTKILALDLEKISNDLRYLASIEEITCSPLQVGSSIMPGKYNPVIFEMISSITKKVIGNELTGSLAVTSGELELNAFYPLIAHTIFETMDLLTKGIELFNRKGIQPLIANEKNCINNLLSSPSCTAVLLPKIGYNEAAKVAKYMTEHNSSIKTACVGLKLLSLGEIDALLKPEKLLELGYDKQHS